MEGTEASGLADTEPGRERVGKQRFPMACVSEGEEVKGTHCGPGTDLLIGCQKPRLSWESGSQIYFSPLCGKMRTTWSVVAEGC